MSMATCVHPQRPDRCRPASGCKVAAFEGKRMGSLHWFRSVSLKTWFLFPFCVVLSLSGNVVSFTRGFALTFVGLCQKLHGHQPKN